MDGHSAEAKYGLFNYQHEEDLATLAEILGSGEEHGPRAVFLVGEPGIGRKYFLDAAAWRVRGAGQRIAVGSIDLAGYDPDRGTLESYARHQLARCTQERDRERISRLLEEAQLEAMPGSPQVFGVCALSIALSVELPLQEVLPALREAVRLPGRVGLSGLLGRLSGTRTLVIRFVESAEIPATLSAFLLEEAAANHNLVLAFLCHPRYEWPREAPLPRSRRFELMPLEEYELHRAVDQRFHPNSFLGEMDRALWECSGGLPGKLALKMREVVEAGVVVEVAGEGWRVADAASLRTALTEPAQEWPEPIGRFLKLAALVGDPIPVGLLLAHLGLAGEAREEMLDVLDESFGPDSSNPVFLDFEYRQPGLPGQLVYAFSNPIARLEILRQMPPQERSLLGLNLLAFLEGALAVTTRDAARLFLEIATQAGSEPGQERYARELAWWIGKDEAEGLTKMLRAAIREHRLPPDLPWIVVDGTEGRWPAYRRLAVLDALHAPGPAEDAGYPNDHSAVPANRLAEFHYRRALLLYEAGRAPEADAEASRGLECSGSHPLLEAALHEVVGAARLASGGIQGATQALEEALAIRSRVLEPAHQVVTASLHNLAELYQAQGRGEEAEQIRMRLRSIAEPKPGASLTG